MVFGKKITLSTKGFSDIKDITDKVKSIARQSGIKNGLVGVFVIGSTASVSTIEYEPALVEDVRESSLKNLSRPVNIPATHRHGEMTMGFHTYAPLLWVQVLMYHYLMVS